ncbi:type II toxin-antitoxin system RelE/ParE family toxin [soil metagenome]
MAWTIEVSALAQKNLAALDQQNAKRILRFLYDRVGKLEDPRLIGQALKGSQLGDLWKYRVGEYRIIASLEDSRLRVLVVRIGHRREVYRR